MAEPKDNPVPWGARETITIVSACLYFAVLVPLVMRATSIAHLLAPSGGKLATVADAVRHLPYVVRLETKMFQSGASPLAIAQKVEFVSSALLTMIVLYVGIFSATILLFLLQGIARDPATAKLNELSYAALLGGVLVLLVISSGSGLSLWLALHGFGELAPVPFAGRNVDDIVSSNFEIIRSMFFMTISLLLSLGVARIILSYIGLAVLAARHVKEVGKSG